MNYEDALDNFMSQGTQQQKVATSSVGFRPLQVRAEETGKNTSSSKHTSLNHDTSAYNTNSNSMTSLSGRAGVNAPNNEGANA